MNWYGTYEDGWKNEVTGERIEFKEKGGNVEVWVYKNEVRGQRVETGDDHSQALLLAQGIAEEYNTESWW